jgi:hypothetical protein
MFRLSDERTCQLEDSFQRCGGYNAVVNTHDPLSGSVERLSHAGRQLLKLDLIDTYTRLVVNGSGHPAARAVLDGLSAQDLLDGPIVSHDDASAVMAGLWLRYDWLDDSHRISQGIKTSSGSFWHAIMHRREGDFSNSKHWYDRAASHPLLTTMAVRAAEIVNPFPADKSIFRLVAHGWDPAAFVDVVQEVHRSQDDPRHRLCVALQELEWQTLFDHCTRAACGK